MQYRVKLTTMDCGRKGGLVMYKTKRSWGSLIFDCFNYLFMIILCIVMIHPMFYLLMLSLTSPELPLTAGYIVPPKMTLKTYQRVFENEYILSGFFNTVVRTILGTVLSVIATIMLAYPLSKKTLPNRGFWTMLIVFTMFFSAGLIPNYLLITGLGIDNSIWALVLPGLISTYNMLIARNFFMGIPEELGESARIDGANEIQVLFRIIVPVSLPIIATLSLWIAVGHWNAWFDSMIYLKDPKDQVLQVVLRRIVLEGTEEMMDVNMEIDEGLAPNPETLKAATTIVATLPIIIVYPFVQKYFVKGVMVGSVKG